MANPLVAQGNINRLRASVTFLLFPELNVTAPYTTPEGIGLALEGEATTVIRTMTGVVPSPEPYQLCSVAIHLLRTQPLADAFKLQQEIDCRVGDFIVRPDALTLSPYPIVNASIVSVGEFVFNGTTVGYGVTLQGAYYINNLLFAEAL